SRRAPTTRTFPYTTLFRSDIQETDNEAMRQGRDLEEYVASRFMEATGFKVRRANAIFRNEAHPIMLADFDRLIVGQKAGLECKRSEEHTSELQSRFDLVCR